MPKPAFIVEGVMEQSIVKILCNLDTPIRRIPCQGDQASMATIAKHLDPLMKTLKNFHPIIIILDRERRLEDVPTLLRDLKNELNGRGFADGFRLGMPDRCIENWILADWQTVGNKPGYKPLHRPYGEGGHGKSIIKDLMPDNMTYHETVDGVELFRSVSPTALYQNSPSFKLFVDGLDIPCPWLAAVDQRFVPKFGIVG